MKDILSLPKGTLLNKEEYAAITKNIPLNPLATETLIKELKKLPEDETPMDLVFAIKYRESKNGRIYENSAYESIVSQILKSDSFIPVCYGHQSPEEFSYKGRQIAGSVIGALLDKSAGVVYYRIIPDSSEANKDIRRWLRNKQINALSIWGLAESKLDKNGNEVVSDFVLRSIDFVPPLSEGQENITFVIGEQQKINNCNLSNNKEKMMDNQNFNLKSILNDDLIGEMKRRLDGGQLAAKKLTAELSSAGIALGEELEEKTKELNEYKNLFKDILDQAKAIGIFSIEDMLKFLNSSFEKEKKEALLKEFNKIVIEIKEKKGLLKDGKPTGNMAGLVDKWAGLTPDMNREEIEKRIDLVCNDEDFKKIAGEINTAPKTEIEGFNIGKKEEVEIYNI